MIPVDAESNYTTYIQHSVSIVGIYGRIYVLHVCEREGVERVSVREWVCVCVRVREIERESE